MQDVEVFSGYILPIKSINPCGTFVKLIIAVRRLTLFYNVYRLCLNLPAPQTLAGTQYSQQRQFHKPDSKILFSARWSCRADSTKAPNDNYRAIRDTLGKITSEHQNVIN